MSQSEDSEDDHGRYNDDDDDEEDEEDREDQRGGSGLNLTSFLFGNIDSQGRLTEDSDFLDVGTRSRMSGLSQLLGAAGDVSAIILGDSADAKDGSEADDGSASTGGDTDFDPSEKAPEAEDFSDIKEAMSDSSDDSSSSDGEDLNGVSVKKEEPTSSGDEMDVDEAKPASQKEDNVLMPPPSAVPVKSEDKPSPSKMRKPLSVMLPEKYKGVDVRELFPEFRQNSVLRFSRLFPIKDTLKPKIWRAGKKKKSKRSENEKDSGSEKEYVWKFDFAPFPEDPNAYEEDQAVRFHKPAEAKEESDESKNKRESEHRGPRSTDWRWGPAQYWYDMLGLPEEVDDYDYGLKMDAEPADEADFVKKEIVDDEVKVNANNEKNASNGEVYYPPEAFLMVTQTNWEDDVVWNGEDIKHKVLQKLSCKSNAAGWVPTSFNRTAGSFSHGQGGAGGKTAPLPGIKLQTLQHKKPENGDDIFYSIFPVENEELVYGRWEDEVIWDTDAVANRLKPKMVALDPNDDNVILGIPDDIDPSTLPSDVPMRKVKIIQKHVKKSRMLLNRSGIINVIEEEAPPPPPKVDDKDPFNISSDEHYVAKTQESLIKVATGGTLLQHATPVVELQTPFVATHIGPIKLRQFHRWPLKRFSHGPLANYTLYYGALNLQRHITKKAKARDAERQAAGGGDIFFMRTPEDISGRDGTLVLFEYMEEHPPLINLVGMASKMKNYYKRKPGSGDNTQSRFGELTLAHTSPFLGQMAPGQTIQTLENNMFRAPVYEHRVPGSDFVVIRNRVEFSVREVDALFVCGQECPLYEVPGPNSKKANNFVRDFLQVFIYRLFWKSKDNPRRIKMDEIKRAFPAHSESSIRKRLKPCAEFHRTGADSNWWVIKPSFRLPTEEEMRSMVTPEQCAAYFSMIAAEQRLKDAGYGEKFLLAQQDNEDDDDASLKLDDEVKCAPWNTSRAYILAMRGKCLLQLTGAADPTGAAGEGFSYVRIPNKPTNKDEQEAQPKRTVTGTDADLRKLPLKDAREILRKNGVPEEDIKRLSRWEVIDVVRTLSTEKVKAGEDGDFKFSRGNRFSIAEHQERYREECQRIFETQNKVLASDEILSSDDAESSSDEDVNEDDFDEMGKTMENMLSNKKSSAQFVREREEAERRKLQKMLMEDGDLPSGDNTRKRKADDDETSNDANLANKVLRITRTYRNDDGKEYTRTELVKKSMVIEYYVKIRESKDDEFIRRFATLDDSVKEEMKKEKRRIQEQLRRIKRNQEREREKQQQQQHLTAAQQAVASKLDNRSTPTTTPSKRSRSRGKPDLKLKCGACGEMGHMRTNKACPKFAGSELDVGGHGGHAHGQGPITVAMTEKDEEEMERGLLHVEETEELVNVEGTKVKVSAKVLKHADEIRKKTMILKVPKQTLKSSLQRRRAGMAEHCDYLTNKNYRPAKRRRMDPVVSLATYLESVHAELRVMDEALQFLQPVNTKKVTDYLDRVKTPMDLHSIREKIQGKRYHNREDFLTDINQIVENSAVYNGEDDIHTKNARRLLEVVVAKFSESEDKLMRLEKAINPLLDDNDQVALTHIFKTILEEKIMTLKEAYEFLKPVNKKIAKDYYDRIRNPMDLETISNKLGRHAYHSSSEFLADIELIYRNSVEYNTENSQFTRDSKRILELAAETLDNYAAHLTMLEEKIRQVQQHALEQADTDSLGLSDHASKPKRSRPKKKKAPISSEFVDVENDDDQPSTSSRPSRLEDDLQYSSDEEVDDDDEDEEDEDEDWEEPANYGEAGGGHAQEEVEDYVGQGLTVTIDPQQMNVEGVVDIGNLGYYQEVPESEEAMVYEEETAEEVVDEDYDPSDFLHSLGRNPGHPDEDEGHPDGEQAQGVDIINDDLDISDSDNEDAAEPVDDRIVVAPPAPPLVPEPPAQDDEWMSF